MWSSAAGFLAFSLLCLVGPGIASQRVFCPGVEPALVLPIGGAWTAGACWLSLVTRQPWLFPVLVAVPNALFLVPRRRAPTAHDGPRLAGALPAVTALVALLAVTQYPLNRPIATGELALDPLVTFDTAFHVGVTRELTLGWPPQVPGLSGYPLHYHLGIDLVRAAALRWAGVDPYDMISRFDVTLWGVALILALRTLAFRVGAPPLAVALAGWSVLAGDFSFLFAGSPQAHWWTDLLRGNVLLSLVMANPVIPALALAAGALIALGRYEGGGRGWLGAAGILAGATAFFKVFLGAQLAFGLAIAAALHRKRRSALAVTAAIAAVTTACLALGATGDGVRLSIAPFDLAAITRETLSLPALQGWRFALWSLLWLAASLGLRGLGLVPAFQEMRRCERTGVGIAVAAMALTAWPIGLLFRVAPPDAVAGQKAVNDAAFIVEQGGVFLWVFTALALARLASRWRPAMVIVATALLSLPATAQFVVKKATRRPDAIPPAAVRAMRALSTASRPGDVVMQRPGMRFPAPPVVLIGRRVPYERFTPYLTQFGAKAALERRHEAVYRFFHTEETADATAIARGLDARYLCLYGSDRVRFPLSEAYEPVYEEPEARVYRLKD